VNETAIPMKFDAARANAIFEKLGDPTFTAPHSEGRVGDYVASELEGRGWIVERREVEGSRFPQRAAPWIGWLGYGTLISFSYLLMMLRSPLPFVLSFVSFAFAFAWLNAVLENRMRPNRPAQSRELAPLLIGRGAAQSSAPVRVVFQCVMGGLKTDLFQMFRHKRFWIVNIANLCLWIAVIGTILASWKVGRQLSMIMIVFTFILILLHWSLILCILFWEYHHSAPTTEMGLVERRGLAVLLELARSWPRSRSQQIEPVFIAAGGQRLNYAGAREVVRILESEGPGKPTLLILFFAPGAGEAIRIAENAPISCGLAALANDSAESLWIPTWGNDPCMLFQFWPFARLKALKAAEPIALIGSDPMAFFADSVSPESLHRAAQLATEIALRWAKKQRIQSAVADSSSSNPESSN
jgi:hypothetical protein